MNPIHILAVLFALVGVVPALTLASPLRVAHRAVPTIMIIASLVLWYLPTGIDVALALVPIAAWLSARLGIEHAGHEPADYSAATKKARSAAQSVRERIRKPVITEWATRAYPSPEDAAELVEADANDDGLDDATAATEPTEPQTGAAEDMQERIEKLVKDPRIPPGVQQGLLGQRPGKMAQPGIRNQHSVPSYIPAL